MAFYGKIATRSILHLYIIMSIFDVDAVSDKIKGLSF